VRLLLDEMVSAAIAVQLRARGHDAEAVSERPELRALTDEPLFEYAQTTERSVVTYNRDDFLELDHLRRDRGLTHSGVVVLNPKRFPPGAASIGPLVASLDALLVSGPPYESFIHWLR
jgi:hypothetical protein